jgi:hypothetical protein
VKGVIFPKCCKESVKLIQELHAPESAASFASGLADRSTVDLAKAVLTPRTPRRLRAQ